MKWIGGLTSVEKFKRKEARLTNWHDFFALLPMCVDSTSDGHKIMVWLETIEEKIEYHNTDMGLIHERLFRLKQQNNKNGSE
jgi:hypothetical protein